MRLTENAVKYAWRQLAQRAGVADGMNSDVGFPEPLRVAYTHNLAQLNSEQPTIVVTPCGAEAGHTLLQLNENSLDWISLNKTLPVGVESFFCTSVPVLFWGEHCEDGQKTFVSQRHDGTVVFHADIIASTVFMLTRWEEVQAQTQDQHERFPAMASVAYRQRYLKQPIIDEYALILREWIQLLLPTWKPKTGLFSVRLTHDIDFVQRFHTPKQFVRTLAVDIAKRKSLFSTWETIQDAYAGYCGAEGDSYFQGIHRLAALSDNFGFNSSFYFMASDNEPYGTGYDPGNTKIRRCIEQLAQQEHEIGFHPGYYTHRNEERFQLEKARLESIVPGELWGGRQHFLRFHVPTTWRLWTNAGLRYDSTVGYADCTGFRCGTCHQFSVFDIERDTELSLLEIPLIAMDNTLYLYQKLTPEQGLAEMLKLAKQCSLVEGTFTLLWHNSSLTGEWRRWAFIYTKLLERLSKHRL